VATVRDGVGLYLAPPPAGIVERVIELTRQALPGKVTHWTGRAMAWAVGISPSTVQPFWFRWQKRAVFPVKP
jgi:hypothetical protein